MRRRNITEDSIQAVLSSSFEINELEKIAGSRWSNRRQMAKVSNSYFDMEMVVEAGQVDFNRGLSAEERKDRALKDGIMFSRVKGGDFAARDATKDPSVKTATPGKVIPDRSKKEEDDTLAKSVVSYDTKTTVGRNATACLRSESTLSTNSLDKSVDRDQCNELMAEKERNARKKDQTKGVKLLILVKLFCLEAGLK